MFITWVTSAVFIDRKSFDRGSEDRVGRMRRSKGTARPGILSTNQSASDAILPNFHGGRGL